MKNISDDIASVSFEETYIQLRRAEGRIYSDEELARLPSIRKDHQHYPEWQMRSLSCRRLVQYMEKKQVDLPLGAYLNILEVGCGNGWLSHRLALIPGTKVIGSDINFAELQQAGKVFHNIPNLQFIYADIESDLFKDQQFDQVIFAASIQYFPSLSSVLSSALRMLKPNGEVHVVDSPFYRESELAAAKQRSEAYYHSLGFSEMTESYFHHCQEELNNYHHDFLYDPRTIVNRLVRKRNVFPWIRIQP